MPIVTTQSDEELNTILAKCSISIEAHCQVFHKERFTRPFTRGHYELFEVIDDPTIQKLLVIAYRGFGKTSIFNYGMPSQAITFSKAKFIVSVSATATIAVMQSENLKMELVTNTMTQAVVGDIKSGSFSKDQWITSNNIMVLPRGSGQQVRGILHHNSRPDLFIIDDLENREDVMSEDLRVKQKEWFFADVINCIDRARNDWRIIIVGTILHEDALLMNLREDSSWTVIDLPLCDASYKTYWPTFMPDEAVTALVDEFKSNHVLEVFHMEFMNDPTPRQDATFKPEYFKHYEEIDKNLNNDTNVDNIIIIDPAKTAKVHNDFTAIVGAGIDTVNGAIYCRDIVNEHLYPDEIYKEAFDMAERLNARVIGYEVTGLSEFIVQPLTNEMHRRGKNYELIELKARKGEGDYGRSTKGRGKTARVASLAYYYRIGRIFHNSTACRVLEQQLLAFPRAKHWDVMDAFAYIVEMMEIGQRYFSDTFTDYAENAKELDKEEALLEKMRNEDYYDRVPDDILSFEQGCEKAFMTDLGSYIGG